MILLLIFSSSCSIFSLPKIPEVASVCLSLALERERELRLITTSILSTTSRCTTTSYAGYFEIEFLLHYYIVLRRLPYR